MNPKTVKLKFCGCARCRWGLHKTDAGSFTAKRANRKARRRWNFLAASQRDEEIGSVSVPYTD